jgi:predicted O-methyltransferase YrrM
MNWLYVVVLGIITIFSYKAYGFVKYDARRPMIAFAAQNYPHPLRIAEIGVFFGTNARRMFKNLDIETMFLIDPYEKYQEYSNEKKVSTFLPTSFKPALKVLNRYADRVVPLQMTSEDAVGFVPNDLDMVYIDGNHAYDYVKKDIELYYPKVKTGGIIGGHDIDGNLHGVNVQRAVYEFAEKNNLQVNVRKPDWWIIKK